MSKKKGIAEMYTALHETLECKQATVQFNDCTVTYTRKNDGKILKKKYPSRHTVRIIHGRLKGDNGAYLLSLMQKIENENTRAAIRQLS